MIDFFEVTNGDMVVADSDAAKAGNVLAIQLGDLTYAESFGIDKRYFFDSNFQFQNESFRAYLVSRLLQHQINVVNVVTVVETFMENYVFSIGNSQTNNSTGLIL